MSFRVFGVGMIAVGVLGALSSSRAVAQTVTAVPALDLNRFMGVWHEEARLPNKMERNCVNAGTILYALGTKRDTFQEGIFCQTKDGSSNDWDANGKVDKQGDGRLKVAHPWPFYKKYWVLAVGPSYQWALVGSPNHKALWILSRTSKMEPQVLSSLERQAAALGFATSKLMSLPEEQH